MSFPEYVKSNGEIFNPGAGGFPGRSCPDCGHLKGLHHVGNRPGGGCPRPCRCRLVYFTYGQPIAKLGGR